MAAPFPEPTPISTDPSRNAKERVGDRIFRSLAEGSGVLIVAIIAAIGIFLLWRAVPALARNEENFFLFGGNWVTTDTSAMHFGILDLLQVTVFVSVFALLLAMPVALGIAIYLTKYAPKRVAGPLAYMVDLLAAVPSIIYGVWGLYVLAPVIKPVAVWLNENLGWFFLFSTGNASVAGGGTIFTAGIVLAVMILPIITAVTREVFVQTPRGQIEAALALGATRWEVVRTTVLPFGMSGYISGAMLGLGRALGETIALLIILRGTQQAFGWSLFDGGYTFASKIASAASEFNDQYKAGRLHRRGSGAVHPDLRGQLAGPRRGLRKGQVRLMTSATLDQPVKAPTFQGVSTRRKVTNNLATVLVTASVVVAIVPLVWVLYTVVSKGIGVVTSSTWWMNSQVGHDGLRRRRRRLPRDRRHAAAGRGLRGHLDPDRGVRRHLSGRVRRRHPAGQGSRPSWSTSSPVCRRSSPRCSSTRCGWRRSGFQRSGFAVSLALGAADDPGDRALHRGDAADRADGSARGQLRARRAEVEDDPSDRRADRAVGHRDRHPAGTGPRHGRDGAVADPGRATRRPSTSTCSAASWAHCPA